MLHFWFWVINSVINFGLIGIVFLIANKEKRDGIIEWIRLL